MSTPHTRPACDLDAIRARRQQAWLDDNAHAASVLVANDVPDLLAEVERLRARLADAESERMSS